MPKFIADDFEAIAAARMDIEIQTYIDSVIEKGIRDLLEKGNAPEGCSLLNPAMMSDEELSTTITDINLVMVDGMEVKGITKIEFTMDLL